MSISFGNLTMDSGYLGDKSIQSIWNGETRVFNRASTSDIDYLCFTATATISAIAFKQQGEFTSPSLQYSYDKTTWTNYSIGTVISLNTVGNKIYFRGNNQTFSISISQYIYIEATNITVSGKVNSLLNYTGEVDSLPNYCFYSLFNNCTSITSIPDLGEPQLGNYCYARMFYGCVSLNTDTYLMSKKLATGCYSHMFERCISLVRVHFYTEQTFANCFEYMFAGCTALKYLSQMYAPSIAQAACQFMFSGSGIERYCIYSSTINTDGCAHMFQGCGSLAGLALFNLTSWPQNATQFWVLGVAATGSYHINEALEEVFDTSHLPTGWTDTLGSFTYTLTVSGGLQENTTFDFTDRINKADIIKTDNTLTFWNEDIYRIIAKNGRQTIIEDKLLTNNGTSSITFAQATIIADGLCSCNTVIYTKDSNLKTATWDSSATAFQNSQLDELGIWKIKASNATIEASWDVVISSFASTTLDLQIPAAEILLYGDGIDSATNVTLTKDGVTVPTYETNFSDSYIGYISGRVGYVTNYGIWTITLTMEGGDTTTYTIDVSNGIGKYPKFIGVETYVQYEWLRDTGQQWISLDVQPRAGYTAEIKFQYSGTQDTEYEQWIVDCWGGSTSTAWRCGWRRWENAWWTQSGFPTYSAGASAAKTTMQVASGTCPCDIDVNIGLFGCGIGYRNPYAKMYYFKLWDNNSNLICNLVPAVRNSDSVPGLLNLVNLRFYTTSGSTPFEYGNDTIEITFTTTDDFTNNFTVGVPSYARYNIAKRYLHFTAYAVDQYSDFYRGLGATTSAVEIDYYMYCPGSWQEHYFGIKGSAGNLYFCPHYGATYPQYQEDYLCLYPTGHNTYLDVVSNGMQKGATVFNTTTVSYDNVAYTIKFARISGDTWGVYKDGVLIGQGPVGTPIQLYMNPLNGWWQQDFHFYFSAFRIYF